MRVLPLVAEDIPGGSHVFVGSSLPLAQSRRNDRAQESSEVGPMPGSVRPMAWELLASGFGLVEGPTIAPDGALVFSDVLDGGVYRLTQDGSVDALVPKRRGVGGIVRHADGGFLIGGRDVLHVCSGDARTVLTLEGVPGYNDMCADSAGRLYVGTVRYRSLEIGAVPVPGELWRVDLDGSATMLYDGVVQCNGVAISADGGTLYHSDTQSGWVVVHDLSPDGAAVSNRRHWPLGPRSRPDGLALDDTGALWVADHGAGRVVRFAPSGELDSVLPVPAKRVTSLCFDGNELIVVSSDNNLDPERRGSIFRTTVTVSGASLHLARV
jgi:xylono-1,5-lactonase